MSKKIIIVSPHFPPSNLVGVHRARFLSKYLPKFDWEPILVTVHEKYYEETLDIDLLQLLRPNTRIEKVNAFGTKPVRLIGDIGLRGFFQMYFRILKLCRKEKINFLYITIPSFWAALLGRLIYTVNGIQYGIDYQDPWVHIFPGSEKKFSRHWWSTKMARLLEPFAIKKAILITGINKAYYQGVLDRNPHLKKQCQLAEMPLGIDPDDFEKVKQINKPAFVFRANNKKKLVYAGAILPKAFAILELFLETISKNNTLFENIEFYFIGTGKSTNDPESYRVKPLAEKFNIWNRQIFEYPQRIAYLDVLVHLRASDGVLILGSTEIHYTPSKVYQAILSNKPIFAILHQKSDATTLIHKTESGVVLDFDGETGIARIKNELVPLFQNFQEYLINSKTFDTSLYTDIPTALQVTQKLAEVLNKIAN